jgi:hypothetical protein
MSVPFFKNLREGCPFSVAILQSRVQNSNIHLRQQLTNLHQIYYGENASGCSRMQLLLTASPEKKANTVDMLTDGVEIICSNLIQGLQVS